MNTEVHQIPCRNADQGINELLRRGNEFGFSNGEIDKLRKMRTNINQIFDEYKADIDNVIIVIYIRDEEYNIKAGRGEARIVAPFDTQSCQKIVFTETQTTIPAPSQIHILGGAVGGAGLFGVVTCVVLTMFLPVGAIVGGTVLAASGAGGVGAIIGDKISYKQPNKHESKNSIFQCKWLRRVHGYHQTQSRRTKQLRKKTNC